MENEKKLLLGHNPITGGRHLGQYFGSMIDLISLQNQYKCYVILDDWMDIINYPLEKGNVLQRSLFVLNEFINAGVDVTKVTFGLSTLFSRELSEILTIILGFVSSDFLDERYPRTFFGHLKEIDRLSLGLPPVPTLLEKSYNFYGPVSYSIGLNIDYFFGGKDVEGYIDHIKHVLVNIDDDKHFNVKKTDFLSSQFPYILDSDGEFMTQRNGLFISDSDETLSNYFDKVTSESFWQQMGFILGSIGYDIELPFKKSVIENILINHLSVFKRGSLSNLELLKILIAGSKQISDEMAATTRKLKESISFTTELWMNEIEFARRDKGSLS